MGHFKCVQIGQLNCFFSNLSHLLIYNWCLIPSFPLVHQVDNMGVQLQCPHEPLFHSTTAYFKMDGLQKLSFVIVLFCVWILYTKSLNNTYETMSKGELVNNLFRGQSFPIALFFHC